MNYTAANQLIASIQAMDRSTLTETLLTLKSPFPIDFSLECLQQWSEEKLRHVLYAAASQAESIRLR